MASQFGTKEVECDFIGHYIRVNSESPELFETFDEPVDPLVSKYSTPSALNEALFLYDESHLYHFWASRDPIDQFAKGATSAVDNWPPISKQNAKNAAFRQLRLIYRLEYVENSDPNLSADEVYVTMESSYCYSQGQADEQGRHSEVRTSPSCVFRKRTAAHSEARRAIIEVSNHHQHRTIMLHFCAEW